MRRLKPIAYRPNPSELDFEDELAGVFDTQAVIRDSFNTVKRGADALAADIQKAGAEIPESERQAFAAWYAAFNELYRDSMTGGWAWWNQLWGSTHDAALRNLDELKEWRARFQHFTKRTPTGPAPAGPEPNTLGPLTGIVKWAVIGVGLMLAFKIYQDWRR